MASVEFSKKAIWCILPEGRVNKSSPHGGLQEIQGFAQGRAFVALDFLVICVVN
jgi:hypothetical protein